MADVVTKELKVRVTVDAQTGALRVYEADQDKVTKAVDKATIAAQKNEIALAKQQKTISNVRDSIVRAQGSFSGLNSAMGGTVGQVLSVTNQMEDFQFATLKAGKSVNLFTASVSEASSAIGKLGVVALALGSFVAGWKIGKWIDDQTGWGKAIERNVTALIDQGNAVQDVARKHELARMQEDLSEKLMAKYGLTVDEFAAKLRAAGGDVTKLAGQLFNLGNVAEAARKKFTAELTTAIAESNEAQLRETRTAGQNLTNLLKEQAIQRAAFEKATDAEAVKRLGEGLLKRQQLIEQYQAQIRSEQEQAAKEAEQQAKKRVQIEQAAAEAIAKFQFQHHLDFLARQKKQAEESTQILRDRIAKEADIIQTFMEEFGREEPKEFQLTIEALAPPLEALSEHFKRSSEELKKWAEEIGKSVEQAKSLEQKLFDLAETLHLISGIFGELANIIGGKLGQALNSVGLAVEGGGQAFAGFGQIMSGDVLQGIQNVIGGVGKLFSALKELFGHDWAEDARNIIEAIHGIGGVSEETADAVAELAEKIGDADTAFILMLNNIMDDVGVTKDNFDQFAQAARDVFSFLERGQITAAQATDILSGAFSRLLEAGTDAFGRISPKLKEIIELAKQFGLEIPAITEFLQQQATGLVDTFGALISGIEDKIGALGIADIIKVAFEKLGGGPEAVAALSDAIVAMRERLKELGLTMADVGLGFLNQIVQIKTRFPEATSKIKAAHDAMVLLDNMGELTAGRFKTLQSQISAAFNQINQDGKVSRAELQSIAPTLALLAQMAEQYGFALDPAIQKLIDMARKQGILKDADAAPSLEDSMVNLNTTMEKLGLTMDNLLYTLQQMAGMVIPITFDVGIDGEGGEFLKKGPSSFHGLVGMHRVTQQSELLVAHRGEAVVDKQTADSLQGGGGNLTIIVNGGDEQVLLQKIKQWQRDGEI